MNKYHEIFTQNYRISHSIEEPSKMTDYDYDPSDPSRRFVSTYLHILEFFDIITNQKLISLKFSSETCAQIIVGLYGICFRNDSYRDAYPINPDPHMSSVLDEAVSLKKFISHGNMVLTTISSIYIDNSIRSGAIILSKNQSDIQLSIINHEAPVLNFIFSYNDIGALLNLLEIDEIENMFISYDDMYDV